MGLTPKPTHKNPLKNWDDLDHLLKANFKVNSKSKEPSATFDPDEYSMPTEEIIKEGKKNGYKVEKSGKYLTFK